jgi:hypothetical protein
VDVSALPLSGWVASEAALLSLEGVEDEDVSAARAGASPSIMASAVPVSRRFMAILLVSLFPKYRGRTFRGRQE